MTVDQLRGSAFPKRAVAWEEVEQSSGEVPPPHLLGERALSLFWSLRSVTQQMTPGGLRACPPSQGLGASPSAA